MHFVMEKAPKTQITKNIFKILIITKVQRQRWIALYSIALHCIGHCILNTTIHNRPTD